VSDFWYHALWTARKLRRGEVFTAKACCDGRMKWILIRMLEWHAGDRDTWHDGRFLEEWADPRAITELCDAYARYDAADVERALFARWIFVVAQEVADQLGLPYAAGEKSLMSSRTGCSWLEVSAPSITPGLRPRGR
jgi:aminoglycoside 6-adenylyltransferase